jgi:hypothetical protein
MRLQTLEDKIRRIAEREDPKNHGHPLRWFTLYPFLSLSAMTNNATLKSRTEERPELAGCALQLRRYGVRPRL